MKQVLLFLIVMLMVVPAPAQRGRSSERVDIRMVVLERNVTATASPDKDLVYFKVKLTNAGETPMVYTNNRFILKDSEGGNHLVSRPWYPQGDSLQPGKSVEVDRVYFEIPKSSHPAELNLMGRLRVLASVKLKA